MAVALGISGLGSKDKETSNMSDVRTRSLKSLYIRDRLFIVYEEMARETGCSVDYLVNEAMRSYARQRNMSVIGGEHTNTGEFNDVPVSPKSTDSEIVPLFLWFNGQRHIIDISRFIIGRGGQGKRCDLVIPDNNISRQHCAIVYSNGEHFIQDLNSTNGVEFNQEKVGKKRIEEGESFYLCDYPISFTYKLDRTL